MKFQWSARRAVHSEWRDRRLYSGSNIWTNERGMVSRILTNLPAPLCHPSKYIVKGDYPRRPNLITWALQMQGILHRWWQKSSQRRVLRANSALQVEGAIWKWMHIILRTHERSSKKGVILEADSIQEPSDKSSPGLHIDFSLVRHWIEPAWTSDLQNCEITLGCCFKPFCV
jgi:hypothetical protein